MVANNKAIDHTFYGFNGIVTNAECQENVASDLQAFQVFSQHPKCFIPPVNPQKLIVVYCFYQITLSFL